MRRSKATAAIPAIKVGAAIQADTLQSSGLPRPIRGLAKTVYCHPERSEGSPGKAKPSDFILPKYLLRGKPPFREYALPLKRERWRAKRAGEGATCLGGFAYAQHDGNQTICHPERSEGSPGKAKPSDLMLSVIFNPQNTTLPGVRTTIQPLRPLLRGFFTSFRMTFVMLSVSMPGKNNAAGEVNFPAA